MTTTHRLFSRRGRGAITACLLLFASLAHGATDPAALDRRIVEHLDAACERLDLRAAATLERIPALGSRLLALRAYLRARNQIDDKWSWTDAEIARYEGSPLQRTLDAEVAKVRSAFESANPGYTLWVNPQVRSVEVQLERWNTNDTVAAAGSALLEHMQSAASATGLAGPDDPKARAWFEDTLTGYVPQPTPPLAAPGLSRHGRMEAVDFQIRQGDRTVAGPSQQDIRTAWIGQGWRDRLQRAVRQASRRFEGPLQVPDEPWHYTFQSDVGLVAGGR